jgi:hypothetical protein
VAFRVRPEEGEAVTANNVRQALIEVRDQRQKILYFEGEPRFEIKFLRRAVKDDPKKSWQAASPRLVRSSSPTADWCWVAWRPASSRTTSCR